MKRSTAAAARTRFPSAIADEGGRERVEGWLELETLYARYAERVFATSLAILRSPEEAEDLTHEVFLAACGGTGFDSARGTIGCYLTTLTRSRALDRLRCRARSARFVERWCGADPCTAAPATPLEQVAQRRASDRLRELLRELPGPQRQVLEMTYYGGLSQSEIAADLAAPLGTVKSLSRRALATMKSQLTRSNGPTRSRADTRAERSPTR